MCEERLFLSLQWIHFNISYKLCNVTICFLRLFMSYKVVTVLIYFSINFSTVTFRIFSWFILIFRSYFGGESKNKHNNPLKNSLELIITPHTKLHSVNCRKLHRSHSFTKAFSTTKGVSQALNRRTLITRTFATNISISNGLIRCNGWRFALNHCTQLILLRDNNTISDINTVTRA